MAVHYNNNIIIIGIQNNNNNIMARDSIALSVANKILAIRRTKTS